MSIAIGQRGIDQVDAELDGAAQRLEGFIVVAAEPLLAADAPGAVADVADLEVGPAEFAILHNSYCTTIVMPVCVGTIVVQ